MVKSILALLVTLLLAMGGAQTASARPPVPLYGSPGHAQMVRTAPPGYRGYPRGAPYRPYSSYPGYRYHSGRPYYAPYPRPYYGAPYGGYPYAYPYSGYGYPYGYPYYGMPYGPSLGFGGPNWSLRFGF